MWYEKIFKVIEAQKNDERSVKMSAYMRDQFKFLGVPKPLLKSIIAPFLKESTKETSVDWDFVYLCWAKDYREAQYAGIKYLIRNQKKLLDTDVYNIKKLSSKNLGGIQLMVLTK